MVVLAKHDLIGANDTVVDVSSEWKAKGGFCVGKSEEQLSKIASIEHDETYTMSGAMAMISACILASR